MIKKVHHTFINSLAVLVGGFAGLMLYWTFSDRIPPISNVTGSITYVAPDHHYATITWVAYKNRYCPGTRTGWIREAGGEPPLRTTIPLAPVILPPDDFRGAPLPAGQMVTWKTMVEIPSDVPFPSLYGAEWTFACNPVQALRPIRIESPLIPLQ